MRTIWRINGTPAKISTTVCFKNSVTISASTVSDGLFASLSSLTTDQYNRDKTQIESDLAAIRVAVEQRTRDAITSVTDQRDSLIARIDEHIHDEQTTNRYVTAKITFVADHALLSSIKHNELANEFRQIQSRLESALE